MRPVLLRVSAQPSGWAACRARGRRRAVMAWAIFEEDGGHTTVGLVARGQTFMRGDRVPGFAGWARGPGCEPQLAPPALAPADLDEVMAAALEVRVGTRDMLEARIRSALTAAADVEFATAALAGFEVDPGGWFRAWYAGRLEHEATERDLMQRLRALSLVAPGRSLEEALSDTGVSLGALLAAPDLPSHIHDRVRSAKGAQK
jgi:hypothetical protein